jgi:transcriptional antiterminator NusG
MSQRWYILQVHSGFEKKVAQSIREQTFKKDLKDKILEVLVPTEEVIKMRSGTKVNTERKFFPGYVMVKMTLTDETWHLVKNTTKVSDFLGNRGIPTPISEKEAQHILHQVKEGINHPKATILFDIGEEILVSDGPFASFHGIVEEIDEERERLKVSVSIFGRSTPVELEYTQIKKI